MSAPAWSPTDDATADLLSLVATGPLAPADVEWDVYVAAVKRAADGAGIVLPNVLRPLLRDRVKPQRIGAMTHRALSSGLLTATGDWEVSSDTEGPQFREAVPGLPAQREERLMHHDMAMMKGDVERYEQTSNVESALESLSVAEMRLEKALAALADRLEPLLQPSQPEPVDPSEPDKASVPQSPVVRRIHGAAGDLNVTVRRVERLMDRLDT